MSGSGGFYKYRCKFFLSHNCNNWVYVNGAACAYCVADGRESDAPETAPPARRLLSQEVKVPRPCDGTLEYLLMELVDSGDGHNYWAVRHKVTTQQTLIPASMVTTDTPRPVLVATSGPPQMVHMGLMGY